MRTGPVMDVTFDGPIYPFERHHVVLECWPEMDEIVHEMDQEMNHNVEECGREVLMHVKCTHDLCTLPLDIPTYLHHILVIFMLFDDYWE
jgi:hypothetical protein